MPKLVTPLSDTACRSLRYSSDSPTGNRLRDGKGLYLEALPSGRKVWRLEYQTAKGTKSRATLDCDYGMKGGSLADAREWRSEVRTLVAKGIDPNQHAQQKRRAHTAAQLNTFEVCAQEWMEHKRPSWSASRYSNVEGDLRRVLMPWIGKRPIAEITPAEILHCLKRFEKQGKNVSAHRARNHASNIFRRAILHGVAHSDPAGALKGALQPKGGRNFAHLTKPDEIGGLLRALEGYTGNFAVGAGLRLLPLLFVRPGELRGAKWGEINLDAAEWSISAERMKMKRPHVVPLSRQAVAILRELEPYSNHSDGSLLFPGVRDPRKPISENTLNAGLRQLGYTKEQMTGHGFRHIASTHLHELGWPSHVIEVQMAHKDQNHIRGTYNKAEYWAKRVKMMQAWADYLDTLKVGGSKVTPIGKRKA